MLANHYSCISYSVKISTGVHL